jgi:hypothetical protein
MKGEIAIQNILVNDSTYNGIVSGRIFYNEIEQTSVTPLCVLKVDTIDPNDTQDGASTLDFDFIYVTHFAPTYKQCADMALAARTALERKSGTFGGVTISSVQFRTQRSDSEFLVDKKVFTLEQYYKIMTNQ